MSDWPFEQPENAAALTTISVVRHGAPILFVSHDIEDDGWQFLDDDDVSLADALVLALADVVAIDATLLDLADLPSGWNARRRDPNESWSRYPRAC